MSIYPVVDIGFENETYTVSEGQGSVMVCVRVMSGGLGRDVEVTLVALDGSAVGKLLFFKVGYPCMHIHYIATIQCHSHEI